MRTGRWWVAWAAGGACLGMALGPVAAQEPAGSEAEPIGSFVLASAAGGFELIIGDRVSGTVPDAATTLETGGIGYARASVAWPGALAANAGDLVILASAGQIPPEMEPTFRMLNYPVRAEARAPGGPTEASFSDAPVATMRSSATEDRAEATSEVARTEVPDALAAGSTRVTATSSHGEVVRSESSSTVTDVEFAGGVITIESVTSTALAGSDGSNAWGEASTLLSGVRVAGQPATIDEDGLRLGDGPEGAPVHDVANERAAQALRDAQVEVVVTEPTIDVEGSSATTTAGSVLIAFGEGANRMAAVFGGARASASAHPLFTVPGPAPAVTETGTGTVAGPGPVAGFTVGGGPPLPTGPSPRSTPPVADQPGAISQAPGAVVPPTAPIGFLGRGNPAWLALVGAAVGLGVARTLQALGLRLTGTTIPCTTEGTS